MVLTTRDVAFANTQSGFVEFHEHVQALQVAHAMFDVLAGMESTDHYWFNLAH
jgi:transposase